MTHFSPSQVHTTLWSCAYSGVQTAIINIYHDWFRYALGKQLEILKYIVFQKSNPMVHQLEFICLSWADMKMFQSYVTRLQA